jgi:uncharacterized protein
MQLASVSGMDRTTGRVCQGVDHIRQSITDILTTPLGTRLCNREYGSDLPNRIDWPMNEAGIQSLYAATAIAISRWYPFVTLTQIAVTPDTANPGTVEIALAGFETGSNAEQGALDLTLSLNLSALSLSAPLFN